MSEAPWTQGIQLSNTIHILEFLQGPVVCCPVLEVLHLHGHHGAGEWAAVAALVGLGGQQLRGQGRVQRVRQQHELELHLQPQKPSFGPDKTHVGLGCSLRQKPE